MTASGGPFLHRSRAELAGVTPEQALAHPTWNMGPVITVNSATLVNKGLELIEAHLLFGIGFDRIEVVVHRQSVIHSMVEFTDGSTLAQASPPDMRIPIALALGWPDRVPGAAPAVDWTSAHTWTFEPLDEEAFPAVSAGPAGRSGGRHGSGRLQRGQRRMRGGVPGRADPVRRNRGYGGPGSLGASRPSRGRRQLADVLAADSWARDRARELTGKQGSD